MCFLSGYVLCNAAFVTSSCEKLIVAIHKGPKFEKIQQEYKKRRHQTINTLFSNSEAYFLTSFVKDLNMGWFVGPKRIDAQFAGQVSSLLISFVIYIFENVVNLVRFGGDGDHPTQPPTLQPIAIQ